ncbi:tetratricopeptide repeat protein [Rhodohalobacter sp. 8-1]|uniref:tetratricopeptide repeat protein n=1 Tax=Rhodohalobacter sp. 8-1 TaxID=3131972 RepID=UPI0030EEFB32
MLSSVNSVKGEFRRDYSWIECVLHFPAASQIFSDKLDTLKNEFGAVTILSPESGHGKTEESITWVQYDPETEGVAGKLNDHLKNASREWVLFLESGEDLSFYTLPEKEQLTSKTMVSASICREDAKSVQTIYQVRLVHRSADNPFAGKNLPDCTSYIVENDITLFGQPLLVDRASDLIGSIKVEDEMSIRKITPAAYLLQAERLMEARKYVEAAAQFRNILKIERLLPFDRLGAVNGLTRCYTEQYKWPKALQLADKSLEAEPVQRLPYLIQYRIHQLNKQWGKAYESLKAYYEYLNQPGRATYDKAMDEKETLEQLGELATKAGHKQDAFRYLEEIYSAQSKGDGEEDRHLLRKILMISIELGKRERAIFYFKEMFEKHLPNELSDRQLNELDDYMTLFMTNKWYAFVAELYERLYDAEPKNAEYRRRLIVALSKTDRIERARKLIAI